ncbi:aquaporin-like protein [Tribonema minus]|uniref:Aquaporin-like protein n=1 Tax=Tribonema minus TaxID=303371 RepID=A0A835YMP0_9STRA|nr:aquaporin-like protein [Tribonema minus]
MGEAVGTAVIVGVGTAAGAVAITSGAAFNVAAVWAWTITAMIACLSHVCGAHFNPAISIASKVLQPRSLSWRTVGLYCASQTLGAGAGSLFTLSAFAAPIAALEASQGALRAGFGGRRSAAILALFYPNPNALDYVILNGQGAPFPGMAAAAALEVAGTALLAFVAFSLGHPRSKVTQGAKPLLIGLTVASIITVLGPITMAGLNPARDIGARVIAYFGGWGSMALPHNGIIGSIVVYTVAPIVGAILGGKLAHRLGDE